MIGGGYAAAEESVFLTRFAKHVTILLRKDDFSCAESVAEQAKRHPKITILPHTVMEEVSGEQRLTYARYRNTQTGEVQEYRSEESFGVFVFAGYAPATECLHGIVELDENGYLLTDKSMQTNVSGVYGAGDVCVKPLRQVVTVFTPAFIITPSRTACPPTLLSLSEHFWAQGLFFAICFSFRGLCYVAEKP